MKLRSLLLLSLAAASLHAASTPANAVMVLEKAQNTLVILDPVSLEIVARVPAGNDPHEVSVSSEDNPLYHRLLHAAGKATGLPVLYNTSFNLFGDPLVCTPRDAVRSFYSSGIDTLFAGNFMLEK